MDFITAIATICAGLFTGWVWQRARAAETQASVLRDANAILHARIRASIKAQEAQSAELARLRAGRAKRLANLRNVGGRK